MALKVKCPCCQATIVVDEATGEVLSHEEFKRELKDLGTFLEEQKNRSSALDDKFKAAQEAQKRRQEILQKKFDLATEKPDDGKAPRGILWD